MASPPGSPPGGEEPLSLGHFLLWEPQPPAVVQDVCLLLSQPTCTQQWRVLCGRLVTGPSVLAANLGLATAPVWSSRMWTWQGEVRGPSGLLRGPELQQRADLASKSQEAKRFVHLYHLNC